MIKMHKIRKILTKIAAIIAIATAVLYVGLNVYVNMYGNKRITTVKKATHKKVILVLGARVWSDGQLSQMLQDRVDVAIELYKAKKVDKILMSGDNGRKDYDEVGAMKNYAVSKGVNAKDIFKDHAGFDTYDSMYRAKAIFGIEDMYISTQEYHLKRAVYIAEKLGVEANGIIADKYIYPKMTYYKMRESIAIVKDFFAVIFNEQPKYLGKPIDINGNGYQTD